MPGIGFDSNTMTDYNSKFTHHITLLRHGESTGNALGVYQGRAEYELSDKGQSQVHALGEYWLSQGTTFDQVISSPQTRARQTAQIISDKLGIPLIFDEEWQEIDNGELAGKKVEEVVFHHPHADILTPYNSIGRTGESNWDLFMRAGRVVKQLVMLQAGDYLVVSHGGFLNRVMYVILGIVPQVNFSGARFKFDNTSFARLHYNPSDHIWLVEGLNFSPHLSENP